MPRNSQGPCPPAWSTPRQLRRTASGRNAPAPCAPTAWASSDRSCTQPLAATHICYRQERSAYRTRPRAGPVQKNPPPGEPLVAPWKGSVRDGLMGLYRLAPPTSIPTDGLHTRVRKARAPRNECAICSRRANQAGPDQMTRTRGGLFEIRTPFRNDDFTPASYCQTLVWGIKLWLERMHAYAHGVMCRHTDKGEATTTLAADSAACTELGRRWDGGKQVRPMELDLCKLIV